MSDTSSSNATPEVIVTSSDLDKDNKRQIALEFADVSFEVTDDGVDENGEPHMRRILHGVSGEFQPGTLTAIMGSSGAGKTTLLNILSKRTRTRTNGKSRQIVSGVVSGNGTPVTKKFMRKNAAYVLQQDILMSTATVKESIMFSAHMRLPNVPADVQEDRVDKIIRDLSLDHCANTRVGSVAKRGLSGGEMKRTSIAVELVSDPSILFCDEPTTGLDSETALNTVRVLKDLAHTGGRTIITTIHAPSAEIFDLFDQLLLLVDGRIVYQGAASDVGAYLTQIDMPPPKYSNVADHFMRIMNEKGAEADATRQELIRQWELHYDHSARVSAEIVEDENDVVEVEKLPWLKQVRAITSRSLRHIVREPITFRARIGETIFMATIVTLMYWQLESYQTEIFDRLGFGFFITVGACLMGLTPTTLVFPSDKPLFLRERAANMYTTPAYFIGKLIADLPFQLLWPLIMGSIAYWGVGFQPVFDRFAFFYLVMAMSTIAGHSLGLVISSASPNVNIAMAMAPLAFLPSMLFAGFYVNLDSVPDFISWLQYISVFKYTFSLVMANEFDGLELSCRERELIKNPQGDLVCPITDGQQVLDRWAVSTDDIPQNFLLLAAITIGFYTIAFFTLRTKARKAHV
ncbi:MAG: hypothetical protein MHM6MM_005019 [Cercozoa sp. M6MM]